DMGRPGSAWLFGIAQKELAHWVRHRAAEQRAVRRLGIVVPALDDESIARIEALADVAAHREALTEALGRMTDLERDAVRLRVLEELDYRTIAARLGCTEGTARGRVHRGLTRLARLMEVSR
ncbi:MAG TPA: sigma-70 family RNA polymerase sigma factor, partial [Actinomycetota bacterium]|nr:sigma-70 family RNA polymerase sigma factor [Actinomycetota bacterium]